MTGTALRLDELLACPRCHAAVSRAGDILRCVRDGCGFRGRIADGIVNTLDGDRAGFFDQRYRVMMHGSDEPGAYAAFYAQQVEEVRRRLAGASIIVDVGCGPQRVYEKPPGSVIIGVDPSYESLRHNKDVDLRLYGSAVAMPLATRSVDAVVCFYSLHHVVGARVRDNQRLVREAFAEFARVVRPGGHLLVFEVTPWAAAWVAQRAGWNLVRRLIGETAAMYFWRREELTRTGADFLPPESRLECRSFRVPWWTRFPPAFALQRFRVPRLLYPFDICMYHWRVGPGAAKPGAREARTP